MHTFIYDIYILIYRCIYIYVQIQAHVYICTYITSSYRCPTHVYHLYLTRIIHINIYIHTPIINIDIYINTYKYIHICTYTYTYVYHTFL